MGRLQAFVLAAVDLATFPALALVLLHLITGERLWPVALATVFFQWLLLPGWAIAPWMWRKGHRTRAAAATINALVWCVMFGGLFLPRVGDASNCNETCAPLRVMSFNITVDLSDPDILIPMIEESGADIVALLEAGPEQASLVEAELGDIYPYQAADGIGVGGLAVLSRYPIIEEEFFFLQAQRLAHYRLALDVEGERLTVIIAHPPPPGRIGRGFGYAPEQSQEIQSLVELASRERPSLLIGDFNITDQMSDYRVIRRAGFADAHRAAGWGLGSTFPARLTRTPKMIPLVRIDYIFYSEAFAAMRVQRGGRTGSDHLPLIADLVWER